LLSSPTLLLSRKTSKNNPLYIKLLALLGTS
jgi:hypothetical protein